VIACNKQVCTLQITDTTGSHQFPAMQRLNIQKGHAFLLVYSITSKNSLEELRSIFNDVVSIKGANELKNIPMLLVGSKCDETSNREIATSVGERLAQEWGCSFIETSAKTNVNVKEAFQDLLKLETRNNLSLNVNDSTNAINSINSSSKNESSTDSKGSSKKTKSQSNKKCSIS
jgi:small GTP-binding protein